MLQAVIEGGILVVIMIVLGNVGPTYLLFPVLLVFVGLFGLGIGMVAAVYNVYLRDVNYLVGIGMNVLFYMTPIVYPISTVEAKLPDWAFDLYRLNPLLQFVDLVPRRVLRARSGRASSSFARHRRCRRAHVRRLVPRSSAQGPQRDRGALMADTPAISVDHVSKRFRLYNERAGSVKEMFTKHRKARYEDFWAVDDISLEVEHGSVFGLVGHNGSGKSTMLKMMAGIHKPTAGSVHTDGRISALLELGAGFHPDLSGRENVYLNAAILGLRKREIDAIFDDIVDFSGLERVHRLAGEALLERHVRPARLLRRGAREPADPHHRRGHRGRRRGVPAPVLRAPLQAAQARASPS